MRTLVLAVVALLALPAGAAAQMDWARAYEQGVDAFKKGNDALAEQKLIEARDNKSAPKQGRKANFSSIVFKPFIPDFYLGVIAARQGRYVQAQRLLESALSEKLVTEGEKSEFALATSSLQRARDGQAQVATNVPKPVVPERLPERPPDKPAGTTPAQPPANNQTATTVVTPPNNTTTPAVNRPPPANVPPAWQPAFQRAMDASRGALGQGRFTEARSSLTAARTAAGDGSSRAAAEVLGREIDNAQIQEAQRLVDRVREAIRRRDAETAATRVATLETLSPQHVALPGLRREIQSLTAGLQGAAAVASAERLGVRLFLSGNYQEATKALKNAVDTRVTSPRVYLFLASSRAAQALLAPQAERAALVAEARRTYELAKPGAGALAGDRRFISPSILELLDGG